MFLFCAIKIKKLKHLQCLELLFFLELCQKGLVFRYNILKLLLKIISYSVHQFQNLFDELVCLYQHPIFFVQLQIVFFDP
jgi:hypothetical protein